MMCPKSMWTGALLVLVPLAVFAGSGQIPKRAVPACANEPLQTHVPDTISPQAQAGLRGIWSARHPVARRTPKSLADWDRVNAEYTAVAVQMYEPLLKSLAPQVRETNLGGVPVLEVRSKRGSSRAAILVYVHGGAFTLFTARTSLEGAALMAEKTGMTVYSVDYTTAPRARWPQVTDQVISVYRALLSQGRSPRQIGLYGDSAGGSIVVGSVLKMRAAGVAAPGALLLQSPWSDVTESGESYCTLKSADPVLQMSELKVAAAAYAVPAEQKNPYVSPVYGDYGKDFPPTLIQGGTREILLSGFVRQYRAIDAAGGVAVLDLYEGMPHVFQTMLAGTPESDASYAKANAFWTAHLTD